MVRTKSMSIVPANNELSRGVLRSTPKILMCVQHYILLARDTYSELEWENLRYTILLPLLEDYSNRRLLLYEVLGILEVAKKYRRTFSESSYTMIQSPLRKTFQIQFFALAHCY
jgi:hypothetical protein